MQKVVKIFGCHRTCTNLTTVLLRRNFRCRVLTNHPDHKHAVCKQDHRAVFDHDGTHLTDEVLYAICCKNPYTYIQSTFEFFSRRADRYKFNGTLNEWIAGRGKIDALHRFNKLYTHWMALPDAFLFKQEDLAENSGEVLNQVMNRWKLDPKGGTLRGIEEQVNPSEKVTTARYRSRENSLTGAQIAAINERIDGKTLTLLGYDVRT